MGAERRGGNCVVPNVMPEGGQRGMAGLAVGEEEVGDEGWFETGMRVCVSNVTKEVVPGPKGM